MNNPTLTFHPAAPRPLDSHVFIDYIRRTWLQSVFRDSRQTLFQSEYQ